ncbi:hypothetical protein [Hyphomicrobium sp.]|uniref:hypothetical protein n=1 Tax=Hyphomicrobium sp. TaxID=82 RepID=UPI002E31E7F9|nr:hypothetical protein [Hyphomicrobium sp.]HEX2842134.1 hypothetical protein [Hyphomicrobium sp.]
MAIHPNLQVLLHLIDCHPGSTVVELTDHMKPFAPLHDPYTQQAVRYRLRELMDAGFIQLGHRGKPRTYIRTQASYRVLPTGWVPDEGASRRRKHPTSLKR